MFSNSRLDVCHVSCIKIWVQNQIGLSFFLAVNFMVNSIFMVQPTRITKIKNTRYVHFSSYDEFIWIGLMWIIHVVEYVK